MSSVQPLPLHAGGDAAAGMGALDAPPAFHVVLGADGSVAIERSHDDPHLAVVPDTQALVSEPAPPVLAEPALPPVLAQPALPPVFPVAPRPVHHEVVPARQLRWSFAVGALVATVVIVGGHQLFEGWSEAAHAPRCCA